MSGIIDRFLRKKSSRNDQALALANRLSFENSQIDRFLMQCILHHQQETVSVQAYFIFQQKLMLREIGKLDTIAAEVGFLMEYLRLIDRLHPEGLTIKWDNTFQSEIDVMIPSFILFPLIQHAVANGYNHMDSHPIRIRLSGSTKIMTLAVSYRMNHYVKDQFKSSLIQDFQDRLAYLFPERHSLLLNSNSITCRAVVTIHLDNMEIF